MLKYIIGWKVYWKEGREERWREKGKEEWRKGGRSYIMGIS